MLSITHSHACQLTMQAGPYLTPDFIKNIFYEFVSSVEKESNCKIDIRLSSTLEGYIKTILKGGTDIFIFGEHSIPAFSKRQFIPIIKTQGILKSLLVVNPTRVDINKGDDMLIGKTVLVPSPYSMASMHFQNHIKTLNLTDKLKLKVQENYTLTTLDFIKGDIDALVVLNFVYKNLPDYVHSKFKVINQSELNSVIMYGIASLPPQVVSAIKNNTNKFSTGNWEVFKDHRTNIHSKNFEILVRQLEKKI